MIGFIHSVSMISMIIIYDWFYSQCINDWYNNDSCNWINDWLKVYQWWKLGTGTSIMWDRIHHRKMRILTAEKLRLIWNKFLVVVSLKTKQTHISGNISTHSFGTSQANLWHISGTFQTCFRYNSGISQAHLRPFSGKSQAYISYISDTS